MRGKKAIWSFVVKAGASRLALDPATFGAHSLRSGLVTTAVKRGVNLLKICDQTGHKSLEMLRVYYCKSRMDFRFRRKSSPDITGCCSTVIS